MQLELFSSHFSSINMKQFEIYLSQVCNVMFDKQDLSDTFLNANHLLERFANDPTVKALYINQKNGTNFKINRNLI